MYSFRYRFYPQGTIDEEYERLIWSFTGTLLRNGQSIDRDMNVARMGGTFEYSALCPEADSLDAKYHDRFAQDDYRRLLESSAQEPEWSIVGEAVDSNNPCDCREAPSYVLFTDWMRNEPPVICGGCGGYVPLYRLPDAPHPSEHGDILSWQSEYKACDTLYMRSGAGEMYGLRQMRDPKLPLSQEGLAICRQMSELVGKPFYYHMWTNPDRPSKHCPSCKREWRNVNNLAGMFDKICDSCGLVAFGYE